MDNECFALQVAFVLTRESFYERIMQNIITNINVAFDPEDAKT